MERTARQVEHQGVDAVSRRILHIIGRQLVPVCSHPAAELVSPVPTSMEQTIE